jgi:phosphatidylserine/phosphatidylglycerophosphate/cardiolipin synthase-like enzyme
MRRFTTHIIVLVIVALILYGIKAGPRLWRTWTPAYQTVEQTHDPIAGNAISMEVYFSPSGGCTEACVHEINNATESILVQAYSFTSKPIAKALVNAHNRGVKVAIILDKSQRTEKYTEMGTVVNAGIPTYIDSKHAIAHNKVMVIDAKVVITGSFNFTTSAEEHNAENMLVIRNPDLAITYMKNWDAHLHHSEKVQ